MEFTNRFFKGLTNDVNIVMQPDGSWRFMKNCNIISQDGNNYAIKDCLGNTKVFTINAPYNGTVGAGLDSFPMAIGFISFPNELIVFSTNNQSNGGYLEIGKIEFIPYGEGVQPYGKTGQFNAGYTPLYHHDSLLGTWKHQIEGFSFIENELVRRVYWTDNYNQPRVFNVSDPIFTTYISTGDLINGTSYMVLEGAITYDGDSTDYGPGILAGNVFTANATTTYTVLTGTTPTPKVVVYYPYQLLDFTPQRALGNIQFYSYGAGEVNCGNKIYFYRLSTGSGIQTTWSYGSAPVHVGDQNNSNFLVSSSYHNFVGAGTSTTLVNSNLSVNIQISDIDTNFDFIELACAEFDQSINTFRQITIVNKLAITSSTMIIAHSGAANLGELTLGDITLFPASIITAKTIATNKNYIFLANTTERKEFVFDNVTVSASAFQYPMLVHNNANSCSLGGMVYDTCAPNTAANPTSGQIKPWERYTVVSGGTVTYNAVTYSAGQYFTGVVGATTYTTTGTPVIRPCVARNRYDKFAGSVPVPNIIQIQGTGGVGFWDYKDPTVHHHCGGYWSKEKYRLAFVAFDKKGNPFYARHLIDFTMPSADTKGGIIRADSFSGNNVYSLNPSGIKISGITITTEMADEMSGFAIMRAVRDPRIVTQGLVTQCTTDGATPATLFPGAWIPISKDSRTEVKKYYTYLCPDELVSLPLNGFGVIGDKMEEACWVSPFDYGGGKIVRGSGTVAGAEQVYSKLLTPLSADGDEASRTKTITFIGFLDEDQSLTQVDDAGTIFANGNIITGASTSVKGGCVAGAADYNLDAHTGTGCRKVVLGLDSDFLHYGPAANGYTDPLTNAQTEKILMNYVKNGVDASTLYGGDGADALANTLYISTGHFQPLTAAVRADVFNGSNYVFNNVEVFGGDCFTSLIDVGYITWNNDYAPSSYSYAWSFPCECNSNYGLRRGRKTSNVEMYYTGTGSTESIVFKSPTSQERLEDYSYNPGYSADGGGINYPSLPVNFINAGTFESLIRWAGQKVIGELMDSFREFSLLDFKNISTQSGRINNLKVVNDTLIVMQDLAINTVPVLERQVVTSVTGDATTIGTGGVVTRWDVLSSYFGNQHQWSVISTDYGLAWFDMHRKAFLTITSGSGILEVSQISGLKGFFDEVFLEAVGVNVISSDNLLNSPTFAPTSDQPLMGVGITGVYDPKMKMTYMTFKFMARKVITAGNGYWHKDFTIGYYHSETGQFFVGFYDWLPTISHNHNQIIVSSNNPKNVSQYLATNIANVTFQAGETLQAQTSGGGYQNQEYIAIQTVKLDNATKYPLGASGSTYWAKINATNELWVLNNPLLLGFVDDVTYQYNSFFGRVVDNEYDIVVNPQSEDSFFVANIEQVGPYNVNVTSLYADGAQLSASDLNIRSTDNNYRFVYDTIRSNLPLTSLGQRIIDRYLKIKFYKKNWSDTPITVSTSVRILRYLKSTFYPKK